MTVKTKSTSALPAERPNMGTADPINDPAYDNDGRPLSPKDQDFALAW